jgi:6-phosphogluconolactonase
VGEDGHTASLFPDQIHDESKLVHAVYNAPKAPSERISLSKKALAQSVKIIILVTGHGKKSAVQQWQKGVELPVTQIRAINGVDVLIDQDATP